MKYQSEKLKGALFVYVGASSLRNDFSKMKRQENYY